jgi:hypothetical protein
MGCRSSGWGPGEGHGVGVQPGPRSRGYSCPETGREHRDAGWGEAEKERERETDGETVIDAKTKA